MALPGAGGRRKKRKPVRPSARPRPPAKPYDPILSQAQTLVDQIIASQKATYEQLRTDAEQRTTGRTADISRYSQAAAELLKQVSPQINAVYSDASQRQSVFGKGFADGLKMAQNQGASQSNEIMAQNNAPAGQQIQPSNAASNVLYGLGGYLPASTLNTQGAAFSAAAASLPDTALGRGQDMIGDLYKTLGQEQAGYDQQSAGVEAKRPELLYDIVNQERQFGLEREKLDFEKQQASQPGKPEIFGSSSSGYYTMTPDGKVVQLTGGSPEIFGSGTSGYYAIDPASGQIQQIVGPQAGAKPPKVIGSDASGRFAYDYTTGMLTPLTAPVQKPRFSQSQITRFKRDAADTAYDLFWGVKDKDGNFTSEPMHYQQAVAFLLDRGVPLDIAQTSLNRHWKRPGFAADVASRKEGKPYWFPANRPGVTGRPKMAIQERKPQGAPRRRGGQGRPFDPAAESAANVYGGTTVPPAGTRGRVPTSPSPAINRALQIAHAQVGKPYAWGKESPAEGFDCSGLIEYAFEAAGIPTPGRLTTWTMAKLGRSVRGKQLRPGDWVITNGGKHVVMYVGNNQVIAAPRPGEVVQYQPLEHFNGQIVDIRRFYV